MIDDEATARALAQKILRGAWLFSDDGVLAPDAPGLADARRLFRLKVAPALHHVFEETLAAGPAANAVSPERRRRANQLVVGGFVLLVLSVMGGIFWCSQRYSVEPGHAASRAVLDAWVDEARAGRARPTSRDATSDEALRAVASSTSHRVADSRGAYGSHNTTCFDLEVTGPGGVTSIAVRVSDDPAPATVTDLGLRPPCACRRKGSLECSP